MDVILVKVHVKILAKVHAKHRVKVHAKHHVKDLVKVEVKDHVGQVRHQHLVDKHAEEFKVAVDNIEKTEIFK